MTSTQSTNLSAAELSGRYQLDASHSRLGFVARHAMVTKVRGQFGRVEGTFEVDAQDPTRSTAEVRAEMASISTGDENRDGHLRSADFFDVETYPELRFTSTGAEVRGEDRFRVTGDLTIRGVTRPVTIDLEFTGSALDPFGNLRVGFEGSARINRKDWGLTWNAALETGGFLVSDAITLELDVSAIKVDAS